MLSDAANIGTLLLDTSISTQFYYTICLDLY